MVIPPDDYITREVLKASDYDFQHLLERGSLSDQPAWWVRWTRIYKRLISEAESEAAQNAAKGNSGLVGPGGDPLFA